MASKHPSPSTLVTKQSVCQELDATVKLVVAAHCEHRPLSGDLTQALCTVVEAIFIHGLRDAFFLKGSRYSKRPTPNFWPFISKYTHRSIKTQIAALNQIRSEIGKARAWIRIVLNENALEHYANLFAKDTGQMNQFYEPNAFLRDSDCILTLGTQLKKLHGVQISAPINSSLLNSWTPSPLALAGLIEGTSRVRAINSSAMDDMPTSTPKSMFKVGSPSTAASSVMGDDVELHAVAVTGEQQALELGMNAADLLNCLEPEGARGGSALADTADLESVYSHPSMMEDFYPPPVHLDVISGNNRNMTSSPVFANQPGSSMIPRNNSSSRWMTLMPAEELSSEVIVHRKTRRPRLRTVSRSSDGSNNNSDGGGSSRCQSSANLQSFAELAENKEDQLVNSSASCKDEEITKETEENRERKEEQQQMKGEERGREIEILAIDAIDQNHDDDRANNGGIVEEQQKEQPASFEVESPRLAALRRDILSTDGLMGMSINDNEQERKQSLPLLGTSLHDELNLAIDMEKSTDNQQQQHDEEKGRRKKFSATEDELPPSQDLSKFPNPIGLLSGTSFSNSTDSMEDSGGPSPAGNFGDALRDFLAKEGEKRRLSQSKRLFSECSSSASNSNYNTINSVDAARSLRRIVSPASVTFLFRAKELPASPLAIAEPHEKLEDEEDEEELIEVPLPALPAGFPPEHTVFLHTAEPYRMPRRLFRLTQLAREQGLDAQQFRCASCRRNIGASFGPFRTCALDGRCYCTAQCIRASPDAESLSLIPARALLNGDFRPRCVSKVGRALLKSVADKPFFRLDMLNPEIYAHSAQFRKIKQLRLKFSLLALYLISCKDTIAEDLRRRVWPHQHWHEDIHLYSIADFESVANGIMERRLNTLITFALAHVQGCRICLQKGFFCELCDVSDKPIYPFETDITYRCPLCASVYHKKCAQRVGLGDAPQNCPKCVRRAKYASPSLSGAFSSNSIVTTSCSSSVVTENQTCKG